ncbi:MAG: tRNA (N6-isopentenyl adenosine(37)-C2)-methylthiotransferase MiaB [Erysipelotrichia bacterium]|nr:tRNA (N6-isopentenyl adenosine(37)-C2)-methylthiotransferase MiaB [Erysipelotrichia bacterium]
MKEINLPNIRQAQFRDRNYRAEIIRDAVKLTPEQKIIGNGLNYHVITYGCQANVRDGEVISGILENMGYTYTDALSEADIIILNTCAIRENAENKVLGEIGFLQSFKRKKSEMIIGLCGCMAQEEKVVDVLMKKYPFVELIFGTHNINRLPQLIENIIHNKQRSIEVYSRQGDIYEDLPSVRQFKHKAFVNIMDGCDKFCTYCIVPYTRGQQRSRLSKDILAEVQYLYANGYKEVTLLGQNVNAYGKDLDDDLSFAELLGKVSDIGIERIRFTTSHPWDFSDDMIDMIASRKNIMPFIHLPLQSGNDEILRLMGRRYTSEQYLTLFDKIKTKVADVAISTDIIVGFPNETEQQFEDTLKVVNYCQYDNAYSFIYSPREGTPAAKMIDNVSLEDKKERLQRLNAKLGEYSKMHNVAYEGRIEKVLVDGYSKTDKEIMCGYTESQKLVNFRCNDAHVGDIIDVKITQGMKNSLNGIAVENKKGVQ